MDENSEGPKFLKKKYDLHNAREIAAAARLKKISTGQIVDKDPLSRIQNYLNLFSDILDRKDPVKRQEGINAVKRSLYSRFVIKPTEVSESYFDAQRRLAREQGYGNIEITRELRNQSTEVIIADQRSSLNTWIDYFASSDAPYPTWLKYWATRSILGMNQYDKEKKEFSKRSKGTVKPFPDLNREALAVVLDAVEKKYKGQNATFAALDEHDQKEWDKLLQGENFPKLYAWAIDKVTPASQQELAGIQGQWQKYSQGSDHMPLVTSLQGHGTGWCTAGESTAQTHLQAGDFYVYYSFDQKGLPTVPRAAIRMEGNHIAEVRGVASEQNLDQYIAPVVQQKLKEFPDGVLYEKRASDMKRLTEIGRMAEKGKDLTRGDLIFLYEIDSLIEGFGYQKDPRIKELRETRNPKEDAPIVLGCRPDQIAWSQSEINQDTKAYVGALFPGIFDKLKHIDHIYTSFPEGRIVQEQLMIGGKTREELEKAMKDQHVEISPYAKDILGKPDFTTSKVSEQIDLVRLKVGDLGFTSSATTQQLFDRIKEYGLELVPAEVGPHYRLAHMEQPVGDWVYMGMNPISASGGGPRVFDVERDGGGLWLSGGWASPDGRWGPGSSFVFRLRKLKT